MERHRARWLATSTGLTLALALVGAGCGDDDSSGASTPTTKPPVASSTEAPTTDTSASTETVPEVPTAFTTTAEDAVRELKTAWEDGDTGRAAAIAPSEVVDALFVVPSGGFEIYGCDTGEFETSTCNYRNRSTGTYITVNAQKHPQGWQVASLYVDEG